MKVRIHFFSGFLLATECFFLFDWHFCHFHQLFISKLQLFHWYSSNLLTIFKVTVNILRLSSVLGDKVWLAKIHLYWKPFQEEAKDCEFAYVGRYAFVNFSFIWLQALEAIFLVNGWDRNCHDRCAKKTQGLSGYFLSFLLYWPHKIWTSLVLFSKQRSLTPAVLHWDSVVEENPILTMSFGGVSHTIQLSPAFFSIVIGVPGV